VRLVYNPKSVLIRFSVTAVSGLALANAPDVAHYLPFLRPLADNGGLASGLGTALAPAIAAALFITLALAIVSCELFIIPCPTLVNGHCRGYWSTR
jgi:hypothetical protein